MTPRSPLLVSFALASGARYTSSGPPVSGDTQHATSGGTESHPNRSSSGSASTGGGSSGGTIIGPSGDCSNDRPNLVTGATDQGGACLSDGGCLNRGFSCAGNVCWLDGEESPVQIVLNWDYDEDLDLRVIEPQQGGGGEEQPLDGGPGESGCEISYSNPGPGPSGGKWSPAGALTEDAEAGCNLDGINIEEVSYPPNVPPPYGLYKVSVFSYEDCAGKPLDGGGTLPDYPSIPFTVQVRIGSQITTYCGAMRSSQAGSGGTVATFRVSPRDAGCTSAGAGPNGSACSSPCDCASEACASGPDGGGAVCYGGPGSGTFAGRGADDDCTSFSCQGNACCPAVGGAPVGAGCLSDCDCSSGYCDRVSGSCCGGPGSRAAGEDCTTNCECISGFCPTDSDAGCCPNSIGLGGPMAPCTSACDCTSQYCAGTTCE